MDIVQAKRASASAAIRIRLIRSLAKNAERLSIIQYYVSVVWNHRAQKLLQRRSSTTMRTISVSEDNGAQATCAVLFYHRLRNNRIIVGNRPQQYTTRRGPFRAPASDRISAAVDV